MILSIYYLIGIIFLAFELKGVKNPTKRHELLDIIHNMKDSYSRDVKDTFILLVFYFIWILLGLFTQHWMFYLAMLGISVWPKGKKKWLDLLDSILCLLIISFILLNHFYLYIDINGWLIKFL